jgi:septum formation protein
VRFSTEAPDIDESPLDGEEPAAYVERLAVEKAAAVTIAPHYVVLAADTTVAIDGQILGKPVDARDARRMLLALSGHAHDVHTGVAVVVDGRTRTAVATTRVTMAAYDDEDIDWYVGTGEPLDKAGAYAMQGAGSLLVRSISGSASNVVGLPLAVVADLLAAAGHPLSSFR